MSASDPSGFVRNPPSVIVKVQGTSQEMMNGQLGVVIQYNVERARYLVHMTNTQQTVALKAENLTKANMIDQAKAQFQLLTKNPQIKAEITKYYNLAVAKLPPGVKPEHLAGAMAVLLLLSFYFVGFTRMLMVISLLMMVGIVVGPDLIVNGRLQLNWRVIAANFPTRCRSLLEQMVPMLQGKLNDKVAAGIVVVFWLASARAILLPSASTAAAPKPPRPLTPSATATATASSVSIEEAYKFGFEDATGGKEFGTSMPKQQPQPVINYDEDLQPIPLTADDPYMYMPPKSWYSKLGMMQMMSVMNIGRTLYAMGADPATGTFSVPLAMANLQQANPMQLGLLGFSVYNILKIFF